MRFVFVLYFFLFSFVASADSNKVIGIVLNRVEAKKMPNSDVTKTYDSFVSRHHYADAIQSLCSNVSVVFLTPDVKNVNKYSSIIDGLLIPGNSNDINPKLYNEKPIMQLPLEKYRSDFEIDMINKMKASKKPILGICAGAQIINVAFGGSLYQDIPSQKNDSAINHNPLNDGGLIVHEVEIDKSAQKFFGGNVKRYSVNSVHHQGIKNLGDGLVSFAKTDDDLVEGFMAKSSQFVVGVQWHPEFRLSKYDENLIKSFCSAVSNKEAKHIQVTLVK